MKKTADLGDIRSALLGKVTTEWNSTPSVQAERQSVLGQLKRSLESPHGSTLDLIRGAMKNQHTAPVVRQVLEAYGVTLSDLQ